MSPLFPLTLALYAVACALYLSHFASPGDSPGVSMPRYSRAAGGAACFIMAEWQLRQPRPGKALRKGPSLDTLDKINRASILLGFPLFTVAMVLGALLAVHRPDGGAHRLLQPAYLLSTVTWGL